VTALTEFFKSRWDFLDVVIVESTNDAGLPIFDVMIRIDGTYADGTEFFDKDGIKKLFHDLLVEALEHDGVQISRRLAQS
jgi:hypothetical protein